MIKLIPSNDFSDEIPIDENENAGQLHDRLMELGSKNCNQNMK
jgi:methionyl-tRNA formyltransferase